MKKQLFLIALGMVGFGSARAQSANDSIRDKANREFATALRDSSNWKTATAQIANHPGYPKSKVSYLSENECYNENIDTCVTCYQSNKGIWWALAKFPTLKKTTVDNIYWSKEECQAENGIDAKCACNQKGIWSVLDPRTGKGQRQ